MKTKIILTSIFFMLIMSHDAKTETFNESKCFFCEKSPAERYAKTHKDKRFKGWDKMKGIDGKRVKKRKKS